jgi:hypothetical protein
MALGLLLVLLLLLMAGCVGGQRASRTCTPLVVDRERAPVCPTPREREFVWLERSVGDNGDIIFIAPGGIDEHWELDLDSPSRHSYGSDRISIDGRDYRAVIGRPSMFGMPGHATVDMVLFPAEGGVALHHALGHLPGDSILLGTSTRRIAGGDVLWVVRTRYMRHRPHTREHVLYAVVDGSLVAVRDESPPGRPTGPAGKPLADTCTPTQLIDRLHHGTRLERLAALELLHYGLVHDLEVWSELDASLQAAVEELSTSCDRWVHEKANSVLDRAFGRDRW